MFSDDAKWGHEGTFARRLKKFAPTLRTPKLLSKVWNLDISVSILF